MTQSLETLIAHYNELRNVPFPAQGLDERLDDPHTELVLYDSAVAGSIDRLLAGMPVEEEFLQPHPTLRVDLQRLADDQSFAERSKAKEFLECLDQVEQLADRGRQALRELNEGRR